MYLLIQYTYRKGKINCRGCNKIMFCNIKKIQISYSRQVLMLLFNCTINVYIDMVYIKMNCIIFNKIMFCDTNKRRISNTKQVLGLSSNYIINAATDVPQGSTHTVKEKNKATFMIWRKYKLDVVANLSFVEVVKHIFLKC